MPNSTDWNSATLNATNYNSTDYFVSNIGATMNNSTYIMNNTVLVMNDQKVNPLIPATTNWTTV